MNVSAFIEYLNKTKHLQLDADYYGNIEVWRQWWKGDVPDIHDQKEDAPDGSVISRRLASLRMPKHVCEDWANLLLNDKTTFQIGDAKSAAYLLGSDEQQTGGLLRQLHFWENANELVEQAYWSGTGAFVLSVEGLTVDAAGNALPSPQGRIQLDYDPACCILPISVERSVVTEAAFVSECVMGGKPAVYLQTHTCKGGERTITNEWFEVMDDVSGTPKFAKAKTPPGMVEHITVTGAPAWFSLFSPAVAKNIDGGMGLGMSVFPRRWTQHRWRITPLTTTGRTSAWAARKFSMTAPCAKSGWTRTVWSTLCRRMPFTARSSTSCPHRKAASTSRPHGGSTTPTCAPRTTTGPCRTLWT